VNSRSQHDADPWNYRPSRRLVSTFLLVFHATIAILVVGTLLVTHSLLALVVVLMGAGILALLLGPLVAFLGSIGKGRR
jgi:hypothetical protein